MILELAKCIEIIGGRNMLARFPTSDANARGAQLPCKLFLGEAELPTSGPHVVGHQRADSRALLSKYLLVATQGQGGQLFACCLDHCPALSFLVGERFRFLFQRMTEDKNGYSEAGKVATCRYLGYMTVAVPICYAHGKSSRLNSDNRNLCGLVTPYTLRYPTIHRESRDPDKF